MAPRETDVCPHCGAEFAAGRPACPECGSDAETGWSEDGITGYAAALPDEFTDDDYGRILDEINAGPRRPTATTVLKALGILALILLLVWSLVLS